ncbi:aspartate/glutamate racemase family protein [Mesorhizobium sp. BAC0120]|uniref:maleate cis-trans isomerase family protein n=1 Tax=Mesorhizobium sp. BAC0120 TaxID=3090670 RepID=UPI00298C1A86|nr:aspartate/glutamate racemase family protein [Mesorhizobium sp. BAC0120]MDW6023191.1 aspartate/glutamate racemase family protein [Mesorhizobium sp. BAC0120]
MISKRTLIGMLTPSSNTVLEPYMCAILHDLLPDVTAHFQRFTVREISLDDKAMAQFHNEPLIEAAKILSDANMDVIAWAGTAAGWRGFDVDRDLCRQITEATGAPATTSVLALNEILDRTNVRKLGLVTPYLDDVQKQIIANYGAAGHPVTTERHLGERRNFAFSEFDEATIAEMIRAIAKDKPEAIIVLCTNFRGAPIVEELEREIGIPVYDSVSATVWKALSMTGHDSRKITGWGRLFQELN